MMKSKSFASGSVLFEIPYFEYEFKKWVSERA